MTLERGVWEKSLLSCQYRRNMDYLQLVNYDKQLNVQRLCGMDEVGRGPLAGPVVICICSMPLDDIVDGVNDSKKVSEKKREQLFPKIIEKAIDYYIAIIDIQDIEDLNILGATKKGMLECLHYMQDKADLCLVDAVEFNEKLKTKSIIKGDSTSYNIACASIIAKVTRDNMMKEYAKEYPEYAFDANKGYGTAVHIKALKEHGATPIHRPSFIKKFI